MAATSPALGLLLVLFGLLVVLYMMYWFYMMEPPRPRRRPSRCRPGPQRQRWQEYFEGEEGAAAAAAAAAPPPADNAASPSAVDIQEAIDFSDMYVTEQNKNDSLQQDQDRKQIQTVNDRFRAAKRNIVEFKMKNGVYTNKQRRQLVESLLRRAPCGRRIRSWRTENSDFLRGDVRPKGGANSTNLIRSAKNNPDIDLHPGALGPMAGMQGQWLSEENLPGNIFADVDGLP